MKYIKSSMLINFELQINWKCYLKDYFVVEISKHQVGRTVVDDTKKPNFFEHNLGRKWPLVVHRPVVSLIQSPQDQPISNRSFVSWMNAEENVQCSFLTVSQVFW